MVFSPDKDIPDLAGKVIIVTGGNGGLGKETILQLAKHNPSNIYLAARSQQKAKDAILDIKKVVPEAKIEYLQLDLGSLASVQAAADRFLSRNDRLDILINNAGIMAGPMDTTKDGFEIQFGTNHVAHHLLTKLLLPTMLHTAETTKTTPRIVALTSAAIQMAPEGGIIFDKEKLAKETPWKRYGQAKLANLLHAKELAKRYPAITAVSVHPGTIQTGLWDQNKQMNMFVRFGVNVLGGLWLKSVEEGAKNQLWAATAPGVKSGTHYVPVGKADKGTAYAQDAALATKLYDWTEKELKGLGY